jgi:hypothetical protein
MITPAPQAYQDSTENPLAMSDKRQDPILELVPSPLTKGFKDEQTEIETRQKFHRNRKRVSQNE